MEVEPLFKPELKEVTSHKKVPVVFVDGEQLVESSQIIDTLTERFALPRSTGVFRDEEEVWRKWVDNYFVHVVTANIYRSLTESRETFDYLTTVAKFNTWERVLCQTVGTGAMLIVANRIKAKHGLDDVRSDLYASCGAFVRALGDRPMLGTLVAYEKGR